MVGARPSSPGRPRRRTAPNLAPPWFPLERYPEVYDTAFDWDRVQEATTFLNVGKIHLGRAPQSVAELVCGTGSLARRWARSGLRVVGLDRNAYALRRARSLSKGIARSPAWVRGELRDFTLPQTVDLAVVPLDGLTYLVERAELIGFFQSARRSLRPGGVLLLDCSLFPKDHAPSPIRNRWTVHLKPAGSLLVTWQSRGRAVGTPRRREEVALCRVRSAQGQVQVFRESALHSVLSPVELCDFALGESKFRTVTFYDRPAHRERAGPPRKLRTIPEREGEYLVAFGA